MDLWERRKRMGTMPEEGIGVVSTEYYRGVEGIQVRLVPASYPSNPYRALFTMATATWGKVFDIDRWSRVEPEERFNVVKAVLGRKTLPNAMEVPTFMFEVAGASRSSFDQVARARIGAVFGSMGWRDNCHEDLGFRVPTRMYDDPTELARFKSVTRHAKEAYVEYLKTGQGNWQDARALLPISACHRYTFGINYIAMQNFMSKRLQFNEQADTVATAWLIREEVRQKFPMMARYLRPGSDHARKCTEHVGDQLAQSFSNLFRCSGRWPCDQSDRQYTFNASCTSRDELMEQLDIYIPLGDEDLPGTETWNDLSIIDRGQFTRG